MKITNEHQLPDAFLNFARDDKYSKGDSDISVTTLIDSPRIRLLREKKKDEMTKDVVDMIWPLFGTAVHHILESAEDPENVVKEERLYAKVLDWVLSGALDHQEVLPDGTVQITDYKVTSAWSVILGKKEWERQQNCYAWLIENSEDGKNRFRKVSNIRICAVLRDWQRRKAEFDKDYPQSPVMIVDLPLWSEAEREEYVYGKMHEHQEAQANYDLFDKEQLCTPEEQWAKPDTWAVKKKNVKRALRVYETEQEAIDFTILSKGIDLIIEHRKGELTRCQGNYCGVSEFCEQFNSWRKE